MDVLEKILEEIEEKFKTADEDKFDCEELCDVEDWYDSGYIDGQLSAHEKCMDIIRSHMDEAKDANAPSNDGWIQVEDELPKETEKEYYPVMYVTTSYGVVAWGFYRVKDEQWYLYNDIMEEFESVENNKIIAWQPLPEPYKPKKNIPVEGMDHIMRRFTKVE